MPVATAGTGDVAGQQFTGILAEDEMWRDRVNRMHPLARKIGMGDRLQYLTKEGYYEGPVSDATEVQGGAGGIVAGNIVYESGYNATLGLRIVLKADSDAVATMKNLWICPAAIAEDATGNAFKHYLLTAQNTLAGSVTDPVYLSGTAGGWTLTQPTTGFTDKIGSIIVDSASIGVISIELGGETIPVHDHTDNGSGGTISTAGTATTTNISLETYYGTAEPSIGITGSSGGTGDFTQWISAAATVTSADATFLLPDTAGAGDTIVCKTIAETLANKTLTTPTISATGFTNAQHDHSAANSGGSISASGSMTGTTSPTWSLLPTADTGDLILSITGGGSNNSVTITNTLIDGDIILTLPNATDQFVCRATTDTLTNKTLTAPVINAGTLTGTLTISSTPTISGTWTDLGIVTTVDINGGTIDGTAIGGASAAAGAFTTIAAASHVTIAGGFDLILAQGAGEIAIAAATSGGITIKPTAISTSIVTLSNLAQTGAQTISIPDLTAGADTFATLALAETFAGVCTFSAACVFSGAPTFASITGNDASLGISGLAAASSGAGGAVTTVGGGGAGTGAGGLVSVIGGASGAGATGDGGAASLVGGDAASTDGAGGAATVAGGTGNGADDGGSATINGGDSGAGTTGAGGAAAIIAGAASSTNGAGGAGTLGAGAGTGSGAGGAISIYSGDAAGSGAGGAVIIDGGTSGSGTAGAITIGPTNASSTTIGRTGVVTTVQSSDLVLDSTNPMTLQIGAVDIFQLDETDITTFAGAASTAGHALYMETEDGGASASAEDGNAGGLLSIKCGDGSIGFNTQNQDGGAGGALTLTTGVGGRAGLDVAGTADGGAGGALTFAASNGGLGGATSGTAGAGGAVALTTGTGGAANTPGAGGAFSVTTGAAGSTAAGTAGVSGAIALTTGTGGAATGAAASGASGAITLTTGTGGLSGTSGSGGAAGAITLQGGTGGAEAAGGTGGAGGAIVLAGGTAGDGAATQGTGGAVTIDAGTGLTNGAISIGATNAVSIGIGAAGNTTTITGGLAMTLDDNITLTSAGTNGYLAIDGSVNGGLKLLALATGTGTATITHQNTASAVFTLPTTTGYGAIAAAATGAIARADITQEDAVGYRIDLIGQTYTVAGALHDTTGGANIFKLAIGAFGTGGLYLVGEDALSNTKTDTLMFMFPVPAEYIDSETITCKVNVKVNESGAGVAGTETLQVECYKIDDEGAPGSDLAGGGAQDLTAGGDIFQTISSTITDATVGAGDLLHFFVQLLVTETNGTAVHGEIGDIEIELDIKG